MMTTIRTLEDVMREQGYTPTPDVLEGILVMHNRMMAQSAENLRKYYTEDKPVASNGIFLCPDCGKRITYNHTHCHWCGKKVAWR